jgi:hypothetical protein
VRSLQIDGHDHGIIHDKKRVGESRIWLTEKADATWWVVVEGPDQKVRVVGFVRPPQEPRARQTYDALNQPHVLEALLEGRDS